jgi:hypothetical protein
LAAELPAGLQALDVLTAIGSGERTFTNIGRAADVAQPSLSRAQNAPFDRRALARLVVQRSQLPGATDATPMMVIARAGHEVDGVTAFAPEDLLNAWPVPQSV